MLERAARRLACAAIVDREHHALECAAEPLRGQPRREHFCDLDWVVAEHAAAPRAEHQGTVAPVHGDGEHPGGPFPFNPGDELDIDINFRGEIQRAGRVVETKFWSAIHRVFR